MVKHNVLATPRLFVSAHVVCYPGGQPCPVLSPSPPHPCDFKSGGEGSSSYNFLSRDFTGLGLDGLLKVTRRSFPESLDRWLFSHGLNTSGDRQLTAF